MFSSVLVANRGEIAVRIIDTARKLGLRTIAVYSESDQEALHVREAHEAHFIGRAEAAQSYLDGAKIIETGLAAEADCIHPGYGFLSESADFAEACAVAGIAFVGPRPETIRLMGEKAAAKRLAAKAGVPVLASVQLGEDEERWHEAVSELAYPVLIKPCEGGGGKGMARVNRADELVEAVHSARRVAKAAFGSERVMAEKLVAPARHIEVQIFGDTHDNHIHLFERDCSLQRRYQKVIEEAPAPGLSDGLRARLFDAALNVAKAADYVGAGTVEFLVAAEGTPGELASGTPFHFLEMNTRLQVEHPVTEEITGLDLVELQFRVAAGEHLSFGQSDIRCEGHAVEARIYAEDPDAEHLPSAGYLSAFDIGDGRTRVDTGIEEGDRVSPHYDPMLAKVIAHGPGRPAALACLQHTLDITVVLGVKTNLPFLRKLLLAGPVRDGAVDTDFIADWGGAPALAPERRAKSVCAATWLLLTYAELTNEFDMSDPWRRVDGFQLGGGRRVSYKVGVDGVPLDVVVDWRANEITVSVDGFSFPARDLDVFAAERTVITANSVFLSVDGDQIEVSRPVFAVNAAEAGKGAASGEICAPLSGRLAQILVSSGEQVNAGQKLAVVEAMKMEHGVSAPFDAFVSEVVADEGQQVAAGSILFKMERVALPRDS